MSGISKYTVFKKRRFTFIVRPQQALKLSPAFLLLDSHHSQQPYNLSSSPTPSTLSSSCGYPSNNYYKGGWTRKLTSGLKSNTFALPLFSPGKLWPTLPTLEQPSLPNKRIAQDSWVICSYTRQSLIENPVIQPSHHHGSKGAEEDNLW